MPKIPNCLSSSTQSRRHFFQAATASAIGLSRASSAAEAGPNVLGQMPGYSPQIGVLISEMTWMRSAVLRAVKGMTQTQLDFLLDDKANRIGALLCAGPPRQSGIQGMASADGAGRCGPPAD
jgi:hypothetical protein